MKELVFNKNNQALTTSRIVAKGFNKRHDSILRDIDNLLKGITKNVDTLFHETTYVHEQNKQKYREYLITKDGFTLLAMGFTGKLALDFKMKYIEAFNKMEKELQELLKPSYMIEDSIKRAEQWIKEQEERKNLLVDNNKKDQIIGELKPKADYIDVILKNKSLMTITQIAKDYGMSGQAMNTKLYELGVQYKQSNQWLLYRKHQDKGYTHSETIEYRKGNGKTGLNLLTKWTQKGRLFLYELLKDNGILPEIEKN